MVTLAKYNFFYYFRWTPPKVFMKRTLLLLIAFIIIHQLKGQVSFEEADAFAINYKQKATDVRELTLGLIAPFTTESEKARVIFRWITKQYFLRYK